EYLARLLDKNGITVNRCLKRLPSISQKKLGRENRFLNLKGRIIPIRQVPRTAIVIDDVMTTGSTLNACAAALKEAGTQIVYGLCLFYD
ncbi:MAG: ComF family protein, partial [Treponema sp.]|nr:ComF family protein [Treponema sp.]